MGTRNGDARKEGSIRGGNAAAAADAVGKVGEDCGGCWLGGGSFRRGEAAREGEGIMASCTQTLRPSVRPTADQLGMRAREDGRRLEGN